MTYVDLSVIHTPSTDTVAPAAWGAAVNENFEALGTWVEFTPDWVNLVLGTGGLQYGRYRHHGSVVQFVSGWRLGSSGFTVPTLEMRGPLPVAPLTGFVFGPGGSAFANDVSTADRYTGTFGSQPGTTRWVFRLGNGAQNWAGVRPMTWAAGDELHVSGTFETAE